MIYLNGEFMPIEQAKISVLDRGFIFGDGVYEVIPVYSRRPFRMAEHLVRLQASLDSIRLANPHPSVKWTELVGRIVGGNPWDDQNVYLQITRGAAKRDHAFPKGLKPTVFLMASELIPPSAELVKTGAKAIVLPDFRWTRCDIKSTSLLGNCMLRTLAADAGCVEAILVRDGELTEASASNVFVVKDGTVLAPPKSQLILPGITYDVVLEILRDAAIPHEIRPVKEGELRAADEIWVTSSSREVLPITTLDGKPVGSGKPGRVGAKVYALYQEYKARVMRAPAHA
jgi:D-alanine transaminase